MTSDLPYGQIITAGVVRAKVREVLETFLPDVLAVVATRSGFDPDLVPPPKGYGASAVPEDVAAWEPMGVIRVPGMSEQPTRRSNGTYELPWDVGVGVVVSAKSSDDAQALSEVYGAAVRAAVLQHRSLLGLAVTTSWADERHEEIAYDTGRSVWASTQVFGVVVVAVVDGYATAGPNPVVEQHFEVVGRFSGG